MADPVAKNDKNKEIIPSLIIGLGGTGYRVLKNLKKKFLASEYYGHGVPPMIRFLSFDTDQNVEEDKNEAALLSIEEKIVLSCQTDKVLTNLNQFPHIKNWFPAHRIKDTVAHGARQIRGLGRLALFVNIALATDRLRDSLRAITEKRLLQGAGFLRTPNSVPINVFLVSSVCGGTGSGMIVDMAYIVQELIKREALKAPELQGYLFLPDAIVDVADSELERIKANGAAMLKELDLFMENLETFRTRYSDDFAISEPVGMSKPMSFCNLVEGEGIDSQKTLEIVTSEQIFHSIGTEITKDQKSYLANVPTNAFKTIPAGEFTGKKTNYSAFGVSSCVIPVERVVDIFAGQFAADLMNSILDYQNPKEAKEEAPWLKEVKRFLHANDLVLDAENRLKLLDTIIDLREFRKLVSKNYRDIAVTTVGEVVLQDVSKAKKTYDDMEKELAKRGEELLAKLSGALVAVIRDGMGHPYMGCRWLARFLENVELTVEEYKNLLLSELETFEKRKKQMLQVAKGKEIALQEESQKSWFTRSSRLIYQYADEWVESYNQAAEAQMQIDRREAAVDLLVKYLTAVSANLKKLQAFAAMVESLEKQYRKNAVASQAVFTGARGDSDWLLNRSVVDGADLVRLYAEHVGSAHEFEGFFVGRDGIDLPEKWNFFTDNPVEFQTKVREYAEKLLRDRVAKITIEDFLEAKSKATGEDEIRRMGESLAQIGKPLWKLDTYLYTGKTVPLNLLGVHDAGETRIHRPIAAALMADSQAVTTHDPHRITLVQSEHGAPLFALAKIEEWEVKYRKYQHAEFLHAITEEELKLKWEDHPFRPTPIDKKEGVRWFTLGDALGFVQQVKVDGKTRYYATLDHKAKVDPDDKQNDYLGPNRFEAFESFIKSQTVRKLKRHIEKALDAVGSYERQGAAIAAVRDKLAAFLDKAPEGELKELVKEEVRSLTSLVQELSRKKSDDEAESNLGGK